MEDENREMGPQPLDGLMETWGLSNKDLVEVSTEQLTHKQVQKSRKGRRVTANIQGKVLRALNVIAEKKGKVFVIEDLFAYESS